MPEEFYIVGSAPILGPPHTTRKFMPGEAVTYDDFANCEDLFRDLAVSGGLKLATEAEARHGRHLRAQNDATRR